MQKLQGYDEVAMDHTKQQQQTCTLCGLAVEIEGFALTTETGLQKFCCAGCLSIYQLLNDDNIETPLTTQL
jgi:hypothetical protein